jgi:hypothetical protein
MSTEIIPAPTPDGEGNHDPGNSGDSNREGARRASEKSIPSREDCLKAMGAMPGLVGMRILKPAQANSIRAIYDSILDQHDRVRPGQSAPLADDDLLQLWRDQPHLIDLLEPLLSQEQLEMIMRKVRNDTDRQT